MVEDFREKTLPYRAIVRHSLALHPARDSLRSESVRSGISRGCFKGQKENKIQKRKAKGFEGSPRQTQSKARLALISLPGQKPKRGTWRLPVSALFFRRRGAY